MTRVAVAQLRPVWLRPQLTTNKIITTIRNAAHDGIQLLAFPETFLSGYPFWLCRTDSAIFDDKLQKRAYAQFLDAAVEQGGDILQNIIEACQDYKVSIFLGANERGVTYARGTVYCTLFHISAEHGLVGSHRKLIPTYDERLCWGNGDGNGLKVHQVGDVRVGGLSCWENLMPLPRFVMYAGGEDVHVSVWPGNPAVSNNIAQFIALEGRVWSLSACGILSMDDVAKDFPLYDTLIQNGVDTIFQGGSQIISPTGQVCARAKDGEEEIVWYDIDLALVREERRNFDPSGHYNRSDVFQITVNRERGIPVK